MEEGNSSTSGMGIIDIHMGKKTKDVNLYKCLYASYKFKVDSEVPANNYENIRRKNLENIFLGLWASRDFLNRTQE